MSGRTFRNLLFVAILGAIGYWIYRDRPTVSGVIDAIINPVLGSHAAVKESENNRVVRDAASAISTEQTELPVASLHEGMTNQEVRDLLGNPDKAESEPAQGVQRQRWTYTRAARILVMENGRVVSISVIR